MSAKVSKEDMRNISIAFNRLEKEVSSKRNRRKAASAGGDIVQDASRRVASRTFKKNPEYNIHFYKGTKIRAGHTELAIQVLSRRKLKQATGAIIGPLKTGKAGSVPRLGFSRGNPRNPTTVDAFYAQMIFGSARAFGKRIMEQGLAQSADRAAAAIIKETDKIVSKEIRKNGFN